MGKVNLSINKKKESKIILKQWVQVFIIIILLLIMAFSIFSIFKSLAKEKTGGKELYTYNYNSNLDYKVYLKPNQFYSNNFLGMNKQYISTLIDHIDVNFKYNLNTSKDIEYNYRYELVATAKGLYAEGEGNSTEIWSKAYQLVPSETKTGTGNSIVLNKTVAVDYGKYDQIMKDFRDKFGLSIDARVDITLKIDITGGQTGEQPSLNESNTMNLQIPLLKPTVQIKPDYVNSGTQTVKTKEEVKNVINIPLLILGISLLIFTLFMLKIFISKLLKTTKKSEYMLRLNKILKEYADIIAESDNVPDLTKYDIVTIKHFYDLVDIEEELHSPIITTEIREDLETWFIILYDKTAYRFVLKYEDFGKIIKD